MLSVWRNVVYRADTDKGAALCIHCHTLVKLNQFGGAIKLESCQTETIPQHCLKIPGLFTFNLSIAIHRSCTYTTVGRATTHRFSKIVFLYVQHLKGFLLWSSLLKNCTSHQYQFVFGLHVSLAALVVFVSNSSTHDSHLKSADFRDKRINLGFLTRSLITIRGGYFLKTTHLICSWFDFVFLLLFFF